jgi:hypothetical protein
MLLAGAYPLDLNGQPTELTGRKLMAKAPRDKIILYPPARYWI